MANHRRMVPLLAAFTVALMATAGASAKANVAHGPRARSNATLAKINNAFGGGE